MNNLDSLCLSMGCMFGSLSPHPGDMINIGWGTKGMKYSFQANTGYIHFRSK